MHKLKKIDEQTNTITWFEIPVTDIDRAKNSMRLFWILKW